MKNKTKAIGLIAVFAAGAVLGILYAPDKGERTRRRIVRNGRRLFFQASDALEEGKDTLDEIKDRLNESLEKIQDEIDGLSSCKQKG
jgi:gas vesicle protein